MGKMAAHASLRKCYGLKIPAKYLHTFICFVPYSYKQTQNLKITFMSPEFNAFLETFRASKKEITEPGEMTASFEAAGQEPSDHLPLSSLLVYTVNGSYIKALHGLYFTTIESSEPQSSDLSVVELELAKWSYDGDPDLRSFTITDKYSILDFFNYLEVDLQLNFHPDTPFEDYVKCGTEGTDGGEVLFTDRQADALNDTMGKCFDFCEKEWLDIYGLAIASSMRLHIALLENFIGRWDEEMDDAEAESESHVDALCQELFDFCAAKAYDQSSADELLAELQSKFADLMGE
jgi:hypothetical protein